MPLEHIDSSFKERISPPPVHESIIGSGNKATIAFIRYLTDLRASGINIYDEVNRVINQVNINIDEINSLQEELDNTQDGAGLSDDGSYIQYLISNYIDSATSLNNADLLLDTAIFDETRDSITTIAESASLLPSNQLVLCDATSGAIDITLPDPALCFSDNRSYKIAIHKIDTSDNAVNILPFGSELVVGEGSQELLLDGEIYNFITDGLDWYLGA